MPPTTPNASARKQDKVEFGSKLAKRKSQEFGAKVARWNSTGGGLFSETAAQDATPKPGKQKQHVEEVVVEIVEPDVLKSERDSDHDEAIVREVTPSSPPEAASPDNIAVSKRFSRQVDLNRKAWVRRKSKTQADKPSAPSSPEVDVKRAGTPKKRVISDGHWRRDRIKTAEPADKPVPVPKPLIVRQSTASVGLTLPTLAKSLPDKLESKPLRTKHLRPSSSRSRSRSRERGATPDYESSGTRVFVKRRRDSRPISGEVKHDISTRDTTPVDQHRKARESSPQPSNVVERYLKALAPSEFFDPNRNIPLSAPPTTQRKSHHKQRDQASATTASDVDEPLPPSAPPKVFGNRIEGWLATTKDPFADDTSSRTLDRDRPTPPPLRRPDSDHSDDLRSSPTLKRRGARRTATSPIKDRTSRDLTPLGPSTAALPDQGLVLANPNGIARSGDRQHTRSLGADLLKSGALVLAGSTLSHASDGEAPREPGVLKRRLTKHSDLISVLSVQRSGSKVTRSRPSTRTRRAGADLTVEDIMNEVSSDELRYQRELRTLVDGVIPVLLQHVLSQSDNGRSTLLGNKIRTGEAVTKPIVDMGVVLERLKSLHKRIPLHDADDLLSWAKHASTVYKDYLGVWRMGFQDIVVNLAPAQDIDNGSDPRLRATEEQVDVSFLLKRPLVRIKHFAKTFEVLQRSQQTDTACEISDKYSDLVQEAKRRLNEEKARLEDEAAASIDPTRAREARTLASIAGVQIDASRCVRARDFFDLDLRHSNGQQLNCKIELIMRDDAPGKGDAGDLLFCEVSTTGKWLLFPPVHSTMISARKGRKDKQLVVMLRGYRNDGREWREVMALEADDEEAVSEWLAMLPVTPIPRNLATKSSFDLSNNPIMSGALPDPSSPSLVRMPSVKELEVPIGERYDDASTIWDASEVNSDAGDFTSTAVRRRRAMRRQSEQTSTIAEEPYPEIPPTHVQSRSDRVRPGSAYIPRKPVSSSYERPLSSGHARPKTQDYSKSVWHPQPGHNEDAEEDHLSRPGTRISSVPNPNLPAMPKLRHSTNAQQTPRQNGHDDRQAPDSAPAKMQRRRTPPDAAYMEPETSPTKTRKSSIGFRASIIPNLTPAFMKKHRRSSSPLKHEYEPSTDSSSDSEVSAADKDESFTSDSTVEPMADEQISTVGELKSFPTFGGYKPMRQATPPESLYSPSDPSLAPSQSASQAPYRTVPVQESSVRETTACIFAWADSGSWESLHPEECCIIVTPGLIEAFDCAQAHAAPAENDEEAMQSPSMRGVKPLVALEMTPLVPLRRGTALDISIRSPPTSNSLYRTGNNIMFRSRNAEECEALYHMLNRSRIDNPTYIALQRARGPAPQSNWGEIMSQQANVRANGSWWNLGSRKSSTYRSKALSRPQSVAATESSVGTLNTAFSALRRFSGSNRFFNIAKSTITSRQGSRSTYSDSLESGVTNPAVLDPSMGTPLGLTNMKIRLYVRETASKWRDMGAARLTILIPPRPDPMLPANPNITGREKRVLITGKSRGEMLLDKTLGEACFERVARTGIAVSVWEENVDGMVARTGGVLAAKTKVYMLQLKSDREAAYTFGLVGKLRY